MKTNYKIASFVLVAFMVLAIAPSASASRFGDFGNLKSKFNVASSAVSTSSVQQSFCSKLSNFYDKSIKKIIEQQTKLEQKRIESAEKITNHQAEQEVRKAKNRIKWDGNRAKQYTKLEEKAVTDAQKQAIANFKIAVNTAVIVRRTAVDTAIKTYRDAAKQLIDSRKTAVDGIIGAFKTTVQSAVDKAKADCVAGIDAKTIKADFNVSIKAAKDKFKSDQYQIKKFMQLLQDLSKTRNEAIQKAHQDFVAAMDKAKKDLKTVFVTSTIATSTVQ